MRLQCLDCQKRREFKSLRSNLFKYEGERVQTCKKCGYLRTQSNRRVPEAEIIHLPTNTKYKNLEDDKK